MISQALLNLAPGAEWVCDGTKITQWLSPEVTQPTQEEIDAEVARLQAESDANQYQRDRAAAYASIGDQLDMRYHDLQDGTTTWADHVAEIKARFPK